MQLAKQRGEDHIGMSASDAIELRRQEKLARKNAMRKQSQSKQ
jgi:hypothetical protein